MEIVHRTLWTSQKGESDIVDTTLIKTIMQGMGLAGDAGSIETLITDHPTYAKMHEEHGIDQTIQAIAEDMPRLFDHIGPIIPPYGDQDAQNGTGAMKKRSRYNPGKQKHNGRITKSDGPSYERGKQRAIKRHGKGMI